MKDQEYRYLMVRIPKIDDGDVVDVELALAGIFGDDRCSVVAVHDSQAESVKRVRELYELDDYGTGDEIRTGVEEDLYSAYDGLVQ